MFGMYEAQPLEIPFPYSLASTIMYQANRKCH